MREIGVVVGANENSDGPDALADFDITYLILKNAFPNQVSARQSLVRPKSIPPLILGLVPGIQPREVLRAREPSQGCGEAAETFGENGPLMSELTVHDAMVRTT